MFIKSEITKVFWATIQKYANKITCGSGFQPLFLKIRHSKNTSTHKQRLNLRLFVTLNQYASKEELWRFVDALAPRGFGFLMHSFLIWHFGATQYAYPVWIMGICGALMSLIPDPMGYVNLSKNKRSVRNRILLLTPWLWGKLLLAIFCCLAISLFFQNETLVTEGGNFGIFAIIAALSFTLSETLMAVLSINMFMLDKLQSWSKIGLLLRVVLLLVIFYFTSNNIITLNVALLIYGMPLIILCLWKLPLGGFSKNSYKAGMTVLRSYSIYGQLNGFILSQLLQFPLLISGMIPNISPNTIGTFGYLLKIFNLILQPFYILQSIIVKKIVQSSSKELNNEKLNISAIERYKIFYRVTALGTILLSCLLTFYVAEDQSSVIFIGVGLAGYVYSRYEQAILYAHKNLAFLFFKVYLPTLGILLVATSITWGTFQNACLSVMIAYIVLVILSAVQYRKKIIA